MPLLDRPIDQNNANGSRPKTTESAQRFFGGPSADFIFLLDARGLCIDSNISAKNPKLALRGRHCAFPLKCGQITKTAAGNLMAIAMGALEPSSNIAEQENRWQWLLYEKKLASPG